MALAAENGLPALILYFLPVFGLGYWSVTRWRHLPSDGPMNRALLAILWLALLDQFIVSNFTDMLHYAGRIYRQAAV